MSMPGKVVLFCALTLVFTFLLGDVQPMVGMPAGVVILPQLAPGLAAWLTISLLEDSDLRIRLFRRQQFWRFAAAGLLPWLITILEQFFFSVVVGSPGQGAGLREFAFPVFLWVAVGALAEELGWRGYLQPLLRSRLSPWSTSLLVGILWGLWHLGNYQQGILYLALFLLSTVSYSVVITWLMEPEGVHLVIPWLVHLGINAGFLVFDDRLGGTQFMLIHSMLWAAAAGGLVLMRRKVPR